MDLITSFFEIGLLIYTVPLLFSLGIWSLALIGLFDFHIFHIDFHSPDIELHGAENFLQILGFGKIPFSMLLTLICFFFGWTGLLFEKFIITSFAFSHFFFLAKVISIISSLGVSLILSAFLVKPLQPLFKDYGKPGNAEEIIGKNAIIRTNSVSDEFGTATVKLDGGIIIEISVRSLQPDSSLKLGDEVLIIEYDKEKNIYFIEPLDKQSE